MDSMMRRYVILECARSRQLARAMKEIAAFDVNDWLDEAGVSELVIALAKSERMPDAHALLLEARKRKVYPTAAAHASVIYGWTTRRHFDEAEALLAMMLDSGPQPTVDTWKPFIYGYAETSMPQKADEKQRAMLARGLPLDVRAAKAVLESWLRQGNVEQAKVLLQEIEKATKAPDAMSLFSIGKAELRAGRKAEAAAIFDRMRSFGMAVPVVLTDE